MIKAVIFDYGGVMKKSGHPLIVYVAKICGVSEEVLDTKKVEIREIGRQLVKGLISDEQLWKEIGEIISKPIPNDSTELAKKFYKESLVFLPGMIDLVKKLKSRKIKTAVLSNISKSNAELIREKNGYNGFDEVVLSYEVGMRKPELEIYTLTVNKLGMKPEECLFIDDAEGNLVPAEKLGMKTVLFENPKQAVKDIQNIIKKENN